jgi:hypothetical protein
MQKTLSTMTPLSSPRGEPVREAIGWDLL